MTTILEHFPSVSKMEGREIGIEIEMEGDNLPINTKITGWRVESDGSLRGNSCEMVFRLPEPRENVKHRLELLDKHMKVARTVLADTDRCGVHVHVNVQDLTGEQTFNFVLLYLLFEDMLVHYCGETREGNLFCLRAQDADHFLTTLRECKKIGSFGGIANDSFRYASVNLAALAKYGSVEFRALKTPDDIMDIHDWVLMLLAVKDYAIKLEDSKQIVEGFSQNGEALFARRVFGATLFKKLRCAGMETMLRNGVRRIQDICYTITDPSYKPKKKSRLGELDEALQRVAAPRLVRRPFVVPRQPDTDLRPRDRNQSVASGVYVGNFIGVTQFPEDSGQVWSLTPDLQLSTSPRQDWNPRDLVNQDYYNETRAPMEAVIPTSEPTPAPTNNEEITFNTVTPTPRWARITPNFTSPFATPRPITTGVVTPSPVAILEDIEEFRALSDDF